MIIGPMLQMFRFIAICCVLILTACADKKQALVSLDHGIDASAGGGANYIITTPNATYYLEKTGGGLSSMLDTDGVDWLGFHNKPGSGWQGEYRGFPNAIHKQDGSYFHAMNAKTNTATSVIDFVKNYHIRITFTSGNGKWQGRWDFYPDRCDFTMSKVSAGYHYWILYEGVPGGAMDTSDFWYSSASTATNGINQSFNADFPDPEWIAFGDIKSPRMLFVLNHTADNIVDSYESRPYMTVLGFGRSGKGKFLNKPQTFSIGFAETTDYASVKAQALSIIKPQAR